MSKWSGKRDFRTYRPNTICNCLPQGSTQIIEAWGSYSSSVTGGLQCLIPCVQTIAYEVDNRELCIPVSNTEAQTKDNVGVTVNGNIQVRYEDPKKAVYDVSEALQALDCFSTSSLRTAIGKMELNTIFENRTAVTAKVMSDMGDALKDWGAKLSRFEITDLKPSDQNVNNSLHKKATAEREKLEMTTMAQAHMSQVTNDADALLQQAKKEAEAYMTRQQKEGEGDYKRLVAKAEAECKSIELIAEAINQPNGNKVVKMRIMDNYLKNFGQIAETTNAVIIPGGIGDIGAIATAMKSIQGGKK